MRRLFSFMSALAGTLAACSLGAVPDVSGSYPRITDTLQSAAESLAYAVLSDFKYAFIEDDIDHVFLAYGGIAFEHRYSNGPNHGTGWLPAPASSCGAPAGEWPPINCLQGQFYYDYAAMRRDTTWAFATFLVNHVTGTDTNFCSTADEWPAGASNVVDQFDRTRFNQVPAARRERFTFIFVKDVDAKARRCAVTGKSAMTFVMVHELGHQRAGLSHNIAGFDPVAGHDLQAAYHNGKVPLGQFDVMVRGASMQEMARNVYPFFDAHDSVRTNDTSSCGGNLFRARSFR